MARLGEEARSAVSRPLSGIDQEDELESDRRPA